MYFLSSYVSDALAMPLGIPLNHKLENVLHSVTSHV
jgi:hypothetical protein